MQKLVSRKSNKQPQVYRLQFQMLNMSILHMHRMMMMTMTMTKTMLMRLPLMVKILSIKMSMKRGLNERTLRETLMTMRYLNVVKLMQTMLLVSKTFRIQFLPTHLLPCHSLQILGQIWLILQILRYHLCLLGKRGWILAKD